MEFNYVSNGIDAVVIDNFYTEDQLSEIMMELKWLTKPSILRGEETLASAMDETGKHLTSKKGVFLEEVFKNWRHSALIKYPMENFTNDEVRKQILEYNSLYKIMYHCDSRTHLLSYYEDADYYKAHVDTTAFTILNYFYTEPKQFTGGNIKLFSATSQAVADVEIKHNRVVLIAGCTQHEVTKIESKLKGGMSGNGRYCNSIFLTMRGDPPQNESRK